MRKILLSLVTIFLFGFAIYIAIYGLNFGSIEIKSIPAIKEENAKLEQKITNASKLRNTDYTQSLASLENAYKKLMTEKDNYEQMLSIGVDENGQPLNKIAEYETEKLWITLGNYAKKEGIDGYMDFARFGADTMKEDGVRQTDYGLVRRLNVPFEDQTPRQQMV